MDVFRIISFVKKLEYAKSTSKISDRMLRLRDIRNWEKINCLHSEVCFGLFEKIAVKFHRLLTHKVEMNGFQDRG